MLLSVKCLESGARRRGGGGGRIWVGNINVVIGACGNYMGSE